jgi:hypothetical protein
MTDFFPCIRICLHRQSDMKLNVSKGQNLKATLYKQLMTSPNVTHFFGHNLLTAYYKKQYNKQQQCR